MKFTSLLAVLAATTCAASTPAHAAPAATHLRTCRQVTLEIGVAEARRGFEFVTERVLQNGINMAVFAHAEKVDLFALVPDATGFQPGAGLHLVGKYSLISGAPARVYVAHMIQRDPAAPAPAPAGETPVRTGGVQ